MLPRETSPRRFLCTDRSSVTLRITSNTLLNIPSINIKNQLISTSIGLDKNVKTALESCYGSVTTRVVFTAKRMLPVARKDVLPTTLKSSVVYEYSCHCDSRYVGRTSQRLQDRIKQHVPKWLQQQAKRPTRSQPGKSCKLKRNNSDCESAIGQHLLDNEQYAANYNNKRFKILAVARNSFHLCLLEATFIKTKHPVLCKQKKFVYTLKLFK